MNRLLGPQSSGTGPYLDTFEYLCKLCGELPIRSQNHGKSFAAQLAWLVHNMRLYMQLPIHHAYQRLGAYVFLYSPVIYPYANIDLKKKKKNIPFYPGGLSSNTRRVT